MLYTHKRAQGITGPRLVTCLGLVRASEPKVRLVRGFLGREFQKGEIGRLRNGEGWLGQRGEIGTSTGMGTQGKGEGVFGVSSGSHGGVHRASGFTQFTPFSTRAERHLSAHLGFIDKG